MFKVGDKVFSYSLQKFGKVVSVNCESNKIYPINIEFCNNKVDVFTLDGKRHIDDKSQDLFYDKVSITPPKRKFKDKDIIKCFGNGYCCFVFLFWDEKNRCLFNRFGKRSETIEIIYDHMEYVPDEEAPQELVALRNNLED